MKKLIYTSFSPNTRPKDLILNVGVILSSWSWIKGVYPKKIEKIFLNKFPVSEAFTFNYARSGMYVLFKSLGIEEGSVLVQGYTCVVAVSPVKSSGFKLIYVDINPETGNMDIRDLNKKITNETKAIVFQHTCGSSCGVREVAKICKERKILLIEDCTNTVFGRDAKDLIGSFGDASIFSFGRDKAVSGVNGGLVLINNRNLLQNFVKEYNKLNYPKLSWIANELCYPLIWWMVKMFFNIKIGKLIHLAFTKVGILTKATSESEKRGEILSASISLMPNSLAHLVYNQLKDIDILNEHRRCICEIYRSGLESVPQVEKFKCQNENVLLRFSLKVEKRNELVEYMKKNNVYLGDWYTTPIAPKDVNPTRVDYIHGMCSNSEFVCGRVVNLPTHINISEEDARFIVKLIKDFYADKGSKE